MIIQRKDRHNDWWVDLRTNGRRIRRKSPIQTLEGALEFEQQLKLNPDLDETEEDELPLGNSSNYKDFSERWMRDYVAVANRASTAEEKRKALDSRLLPAFGHLPLYQITTNTVDAQVAIWMRSGLSIKRINNLSTILRKSLRCAAEWGLIKQAPTIRHHKYFPPVPRFLTQTESDRLLATMEPGFWRTFTFFLLATGVRFGEAAALKWEDLRLDDVHPIVLIRRAVNRQTGTTSVTRSRAPSSNAGHHSLPCKSSSVTPTSRSRCDTRIWGRMHFETRCPFSISQVIGTCGRLYRTHALSMSLARLDIRTRHL